MLVETSLLVEVEEVRDDAESAPATSDARPVAVARGPESFAGVLSKNESPFVVDCVGLELKLAFKPECSEELFLHVMVSL
jgi:hypothetical protein